MKVVHVLGELRPSGAEVMLRCSYSYWRDKGVVPVLLATGEQRGEYAGVLEKSGYQVHHIPFRKSMFYLIDIYRFFLKEQFDLVHLHTERGYFYYALLARFAGVKKIVRTLHSNFPLKGMKRIRAVVQRALCRRMGVVFCAISDQVEDNENERFLNSCYRVTNWIGDDFCPVDPALRKSARTSYGVEGNMVFCSVGNCADVKNHKAIIEALAHVRADQIIYLHAGKEDEAFSERDLVQKLGLENIRFLGVVENVKELLSAADYFIMPSLYEGVGLAAGEALAMGIPCVLSDVSGLQEYKGVPGVFWVEPNAESIAQTLRKILSSEIFQRPDSREMYEEINRRFGVKNGIERYSEIYGQA